MTKITGYQKEVDEFEKWVLKKKVMKKSVSEDLSRGSEHFR